jgi:hypothetical protein
MEDTMNAHTGTLTLLGAGAAATGGAVLTRRWYHRWGATDEELRRPMPLDERVPNPTIASTMAITINAPADAIWPWLVQMGDPPRAGYYSYTVIERLAGMRIENAGRILPEHQHVEVGQALDRNGTMVVQAVEPGRHLVLGPPPTIPGLACTWAFGLYPIDTRSTRLVVRLRARWDMGARLRTTEPLQWPLYLLIDPGAFLMTRKMLREIRRHAERAARAPDPAPTELLNTEYRPPDTAEIRP